MIGENIKKARKARKMMSKDLAKKLDIVASTLTGYEKGTNNISIENIKKISKILNVPLDLLVNGVDKRFKDEYSFEDLVKNPDLYNEYLSRISNKAKPSSIEAFFKDILKSDKKQAAELLIKLNNIYLND